MGAWNYGVFDDDTAYDALDHLLHLLYFLLSFDSHLKRYTNFT